VVIGASAGGVPLLLALAAALPADLPASILIVQHVGAHPSLLPELLRRQGARAVHPESGDTLEHGTLYVAPPDRHLLVQGDTLLLTREAKENHARPAIDPLFRSAAISHGPRVIGMILSGRLDDGTAGLQVVKACGGLTIVQDPVDAEEPGMPASALSNVAVDIVVGRDSMARALLDCIGQPVVLPARTTVPKSFATEHALSLHDGNDMASLDTIGSPSRIVCPDCNGVLWEITGARPKRYRCHSGHAYTIQTLSYEQATRTDEALWKALRALHERESLLRDMAATHGDAAHARHLEAEAEHVSRHALQLQDIIARQPA
jgi:two-component system chemotaxis response regulator CheB